MTIKKICQRAVDLADPDESVQAVAQRMSARNVGTLVVLDDLKRPVGIITDRDLAIRVVAAGKDPYATKAAEVMTSGPRTISEETPVENALKAMRKASVRRLPVVATSGKLVGVVSLDDILRLLSEEFGLLEKLLDEESPQKLACS